MTSTSSSESFFQRCGGQRGNPCTVPCVQRPGPIIRRQCQTAVDHVKDFFTIVLADGISAVAVGREFLKHKLNAAVGVGSKGLICKSVVFAGAMELSPLVLSNDHVFLRIAACEQKKQQDMQGSGNQLQGIDRGVCQVALDLAEHGGGDPRHRAQVAHGHMAHGAILLEFFPEIQLIHSTAISLAEVRKISYHNHPCS